MRKSLIKVFSVICLLSTLLSLVSCQDQEEAQDNKHSETVYYTVTFNSNGGTPIESVKIQEGGHASAPEAPVLENYIFCRWELYGEPWFFESKRVTSDITLSAKWIPAESLLGIIPVEGGLEITEIIRQERLEVLAIPSVINGKTVVSISDGAFENIHNEHAEQIILPNTIKKIGNEAFKGISKSQIIFSGSVSEIGENTFAECSTLSQITLDSVMEDIPFGAFWKCTALTAIEIPNSVKVIKEDAFSGCTALQAIILSNSLEVIETGAFDKCSSLAVIFFKGTAEELDNIDVERNNTAINEATVYIYSEQKPSEDGSFWHYDENNLPVVW